MGDRDIFFAELGLALDAADLDEALAAVLRFFEAQAGTIHLLGPGVEGLELVAVRGMPAGVLAKIKRIPVGKGMAGLAVQRREPVRICNLQTDESGDAQPGARATGMEGSIAVPLMVDGRVLGALGVAKTDPYEWPEEQRNLLLEAGWRIGEAANSIPRSTDSSNY